MQVNRTFSPPGGEDGDDRWSTWQAEMAGTSSGPTVAQVLVILALVAAVLVGLLSSSTTATAEGGRPRSPACAELARLQRHHVTSGLTYRRVAHACRERDADRRPAR